MRAFISHRTLASGVLVAVILVCGQAISAGLLQTDPSGPVNDFAGLLSPSARLSLEAISVSLQRRLGFSLVVATVRSLDGGDIDDVANRLYEKWGIGAKGADEGALILLSVEDRAFRIETGYGAEGYLPDAVAAAIRDKAAPYLSKGMWDDGVLYMAVSVGRVVAGNAGTTLDSIVGGVSIPGTPATARGRHGPAQGILALLFILFFVLTPMGRRMLPWILLAAMSSGSGRGRGSHGGFGGGFGGGGFGGFGGGSSGGGGASGRF